MLAELCLEPECRRGHGGVYDALNCGEVRIGRLRRALCGLPLRRWDDGRIRLACDVSELAAAGRGDQPGAAVLPLLRAGEGERADDPGLAVLLRRGAGARAAPRGRCRWTRSGSARPTTPPRSPPPRSATWSPGWSQPGTGASGDPDILVVFDSGYDLTRLAWLLRRPARGGHRPAAQRPGDVLPAPPRGSRARAAARPGTGPGSASASRDLAGPGRDHRHGDRPVRHRHRHRLGPRLHQQLARRAAWERPPGRAARHRGHPHPAPGRSPARRPRRRSRCGCGPPAPPPPPSEVNRAWQAFLRRFDIEHTFRFLKQQLGWTRPKLRDPAAADRWTWLVIAAYAQLYLARGLAADIRLPWQRPCPPGRLTPARVRRGFRNIHQHLPVLPARRNPPGPAPGARPARRTAGPPPATTSAKPSSEKNPEENQQAGRVAVGTAIAGGPPRRSQRAELPHWAPVMSTWRRTACQAMDAWSWPEAGSGRHSGASVPS